ncbi:hypothetical protein [Papillibacter cinnamivorans]|uniref:Uncharacterized protein n=1 Tax=Papillibacter cinnamivorans DSM 12816 TaxID=1122930 RepID=A0A1W1YXY3_9FIRM|nr:hypothetical protein [Papillibacter cinnamivorans]SMC40994.1 hypothetical protein SAMN02745168_0763 [Papillibacter cinnamivorans DSM 12816]
MALGSQYDILSDEDKQKVQQNTADWEAATAAGDTKAAEQAHINNAAIWAKPEYGLNTSADGSTQTQIQQPAAATAADYGTSNTAESYINDMVANETAGELASIENDYQNNVSSLDRAEAKIPETYYAARNAAAKTSMQNQNAWNELANARGLNTGATGQAALSRQNALQSSLTGINTQEANAKSDIALQRQQLAADYQAQIASARSSGNATLANMLYQEWVRQDELTQQQAQYEQERSDTTAKENAQALASIGDYSGYKTAYGWTDAQVQQANALFKAQQTAASASSSSSSGSSSSSKSLTYTQAKALADNGVYTDNVINALKEYGFSDSDIFRMYPNYNPATHGAISSAKVQMLDDWYKDATPYEFKSWVQRAISNGKLTDSEYEAWANS